MSAMMVPTSRGGRGEERKTCMSDDGSEVEMFDARSKVVRLMKMIQEACVMDDL